MKNIMLLFAFLLPASLSAQTLQSHSTTYAVVVGISDYQDEGIPDLRFADKDAEAFANFLRSPAGGSLDHDQLQLLTNEQATGSQIAINLDWLIDVANEGDRVIIYFSGHGDVESKRISQPGYLLGWDAPSRVYAAGGAMNIRDLQDIISTLSVFNKAKVMVIADACRSGKLSGSDIDGARLTSQNLARQFENEIKVLSCQPNEYSIEGEQWGDGRGAFSYHLLDGLYGMADANEDMSVNLIEIRGYLEQNVSREVAPHSQLPMTVGNGRERLVEVVPELLALVKEGKKGQMQLFSATEQRGLEAEVLEKTDSNIVEMYFAFKRSLEDKQFLAPQNACADLYYEKLSQEPKLKRLHSSMRRNYSAALQDDAQQVMNTMLKSGLTDLVLKGADPASIYGNYPAYLNRAAELLGEDHYMYNTLQARKHLFEGLILKERSDKRQAFRKALSLQAEMAHAMVYLTRFSEAEQADSAKYYFQKAAALTPSWVEPYIALSGFYRLRTKQYDKAEEMLHLAGKVDSTSVLVWFKKANLSLMQGKYQLAEKWYLKTIEANGEGICFPCAYNNFGWVYFATHRFKEAEQAWKKSIQLDSAFFRAYGNLGFIYKTTKRYEEAEKYYLKAIEQDSSLAWLCINLGAFYKETQRYEEAEKYYFKAIQLDSFWTDSYLYLGLLYQQVDNWEAAKNMVQKGIVVAPNNGELHALLGNIYSHLPLYLNEVEPTLRKALGLSPDLPDIYIYFSQWSLKNKQLTEAWEYLQTGLEKGLENGNLEFDYLQSEPDFESMRNDPKWDALIKKYISEQVKE